MDKAVNWVDIRGLNCRNLDFSGKWVGIFAKEPTPGNVKTRLCPPLTPEQAARFHEISLRETVDTLTAPDLPFRTLLCPAGPPAWFRQNFPQIPLLPQGEGDLGARMSRVLEALLTSGADAAILVGSDSPDLPPALLRDAFAALETAEAVVSPATDGGYVLIGESRHRPELFQEIPWSTPEVLPRTRQRALESGIVYSEIGGWEDVDDIDSLKRLLQRSPDSPSARLASQFISPSRPSESSPATGLSIG